MSKQFCIVQFYRVIIANIVYKGFHDLYVFFYCFFIGVVVKELSRPFNEDDDRSFDITHTMNEYIHWNLDKDPSINDKYQQAMQWLDIANAVSIINL